MNSDHIKSLKISEDTKEELDILGRKGESYDEIIKKSITFSKKFTDESEFHAWFTFHYSLFGFDEIIKSQRTKYPDIIAMKNGKEVRIELEIYSSNFIVHKHDPAGVDLVICLIKDKDLPVETIEIPTFDCLPKDIIKHISCSDETFEKFRMYQNLLQLKYPKDNVTQNYTMKKLMEGNIEVEQSNKFIEQLHEKLQENQEVKA